QAGTYHRQAVIAVPAQCGDQISDSRGVAYGYHPLRAETLAAQPVQALAEPGPGHHIEYRRAGQGDHEVAAGKIELERVGEDSHTGGQAHRRVQHPAELLGTHADEARFIAPAQGHRCPPEGRQCRGEGKVGDRQVALAGEAQLCRQGAGCESASAVSKRCPALVVPCPGGRTPDCLPTAVLGSNCVTSNAHGAPFRSFKTRSSESEMHREDAALTGRVYAYPLTM